VRVYLSAPMTGVPDFNYPALDAASELLRSHSHVPVSPADMDREGGYTTKQAALRRDLVALCSCDAIAFLPGWERSAGALLERHVAESIGLPCYRVTESRFYRESLIGIAGYARTGKDTLAAIFERYGYERRGFADPVRAILYALDPLVRIDDGVASVAQLVDAFGWEEAKAYGEVRALLQRLGTEGGRRHLGENVWVDTLLRTPSAGRIVVSDVRFPNEADAIRERGGIVVRLTRPGVSALNDHPSEHALDDYEFDYRVVNESVENLEREAVRILGELTCPNRFTPTALSARR